MKPVISIVTVSYNAASVIEETLKSVLSQTYTDYEYIFIDGNSQDRTVEIIESYRERFESLGVRYQVISEPDDGVYDAMNKGIDRANGQWVIMMNAGDRFLDNCVLYDVFSQKDYAADILYGDTVCVDFCRGHALYKFAPAQPLKKINQSIPFCHQSVFVRNETIKKYRFDTVYRLVADFDMFLRAYIDGVKFQYVQRAISLYDYGGISMQNPKKLADESAKVREKLGIESSAYKKNAKVLCIKVYLRSLLKKYFPSILFSQKRGWYPLEKID